ncbi:MAG: outer membrane beta-barrel protein [Crocinitomicaceae bacterium]|nr:outer membrane beta-barrel protein [Crocinitomicaceae bacterium]
MNKLITFLLTISITPLIQGQFIAEDVGLTSRFKPGIGWFYSGAEPYEEKKLRKYDRLVVDIVYNDWHGDRAFFDSPLNSLGFNVSLFFNKVLTPANTISFGYGLSYSHYNNRTRLFLERNTTDNLTELITFPDMDNTLRYKFTANYLELPLEMRFRTKGRKHFKWIVGGTIGYQLNSFTQRVFELNGTRYSNRVKGFPDNNDWRLGATMRLGIRNYAFYTAYYFTPFFTAENSVNLTPFSMGVSISLF